MKKLIMLLSSALIVGLLIWNPAKTKNNGGNNTEGYEYYYNEETTAEDGSMLNEKNALANDNHETSNNNANNITPASTSPELDLTADSLTVFVNKEYALPSDYIPENLTIPNVLFDFNGIQEKRYLRKEAALALEKLFSSAKEDRLFLYAISGYRSYKRQEEIYTNNVRLRGLTAANAVSAVPGYSEHQSGLAMDISCLSLNFRLSEAFSGTPEGRWIANQSHRFGFIIRYPKDKTHITGYSYEPWHIRYVGTELASFLYKNKLTLEEYYGYTPNNKPSGKPKSDTIVDIDEAITSSPTPKPADILDHKDSQQNGSIDKNKKTDNKKKDTKSKKENAQSTESKAIVKTPKPTLAPTPSPTTEPLSTEPLSTEPPDLIQGEVTEDPLEHTSQ